MSTQRRPAADGVNASRPTSPDEQSGDDAAGEGRAVRLALLTNIVPPYRVRVYNALAKRFELHILLSGREDNRDGWSAYEDDLRVASVKRSMGATIKYFSPRSGQAYDDRFLHVNPGYLLDLLRLRPDGVITHEFGFRTLSALLYCAAARVPLWVSWEGGSHGERDVGRARRLVRRFVAARADRWISWGQSASEYLRTLGVPTARIVQVQSCVDERLFAESAAPEPALAPFGPSPVVLVVSRLVPAKGISLLLDAVATVRREARAFTVVIVGDGPERDSLAAHAARLGLDNVQFHLARPMADMPSYYRNADLLVFPTLHDSWGLVVNEALWSGLPALVSRYAGCADELVPRDQIFDPTDPDEFASVLRRAIEEGLPPASTAPLMPVAEVVRRIAADVELAVGPR